MTTTFRIKGQFPSARYMRFQTYSSTQGDALQDFQIVPDSGSVKPFQPGTDHELSRAHTLRGSSPPIVRRIRAASRYPQIPHRPISCCVLSVPIRISQTEGCRYDRSLRWQSRTIDCMSGEGPGG